MRVTAASSTVRFLTATILFVLMFYYLAQPALAATAKSASYEVGLAKIDITPEGPIRLSGFYVRQTESVGVRQNIFARAMAIRAGGADQPAVLITVDSIGIPIAVRNEVARRLEVKKKIPNERV